MVLNPFASGHAQAFARELAASIVDELGDAAKRTTPKFRSRAERTLQKAARRVDAFKAEHRLNWWQRSRAANAFLWALKDRHCPEDYASELAEWFVARL